MKGELKKVETRDKLLLDGIICRPKSSPKTDMGIIHVHGAYGNFYEDMYLEEMAEVFTGLGLTFISISTRGRDYIADFKVRKKNEYKWKRIGSSREIFQECKHDIEAWHRFALEAGISKIIFQGHSLGALKVIYYIKECEITPYGLILLSPPDYFNLQSSRNCGRQKKYLEVAKQLTQKDKFLLMPKRAYIRMISAATYLSLFANPEETGMFTYSDVHLMKRAGISTINCPTLVTFTEPKELVTFSLERCIQALSNAIHPKTNLHCEIIKGTNHNYHMKEKLLAKTIKIWLQEKVLEK